MLGVPVALLLALSLSFTQLGRSVLFALTIQFHELGHALVAWLSSRAALPLPFGFTFWQEERSTFVGLCVVFLIGVFSYRAWLEQKRIGLCLGVGALLLWGLFSCILSAERSMMWVIAGGVAGEFILSALAISAFHFPLPDRLRWDFVRFFALVPATAVWLASTRLWLGVARQTEPMPMGTLLGIGDVSGDLDRLISDYGFSEASLTKLYLTFALISGLSWLAVYSRFGLRAFRTLRARTNR